MSPETWAAAGIVGVACVTDVRTRRIPNLLTFGSAAAALAFHGLAGTGSGVAMAVLGWVVGLVLFLPLFVLRGMGGGDVKLLAALGAWLGPGPIVWVALWSAVAGGVFALVVSARHGYTRKAFRNVWGLLSYWRVMGLRPHPDVTLESPRSPRVPYALPMAAGLALFIWLR